MPICPTCGKTFKHDLSQLYATCTHCADKFYIVPDLLAAEEKKEWFHLQSERRKVSSEKREVATGQEIERDKLFSRYPALKFLVSFQGAISSVLLYGGGFLVIISALIVLSNRNIDGGGKFFLLLFAPLVWGLFFYLPSIAIRAGIELITIFLRMESHLSVIKDK